MGFSTLETEISSILSVLVLVSNGEEPCMLTESGPSPPYLIRIIDRSVDSLIYGHGSLIRQDKVLSTCTPYKDSSQDLVNGKWRLSGYNFETKCEQRRHPVQIEIHEACKISHGSTAEMISLDLAMWTVEPFIVEGSPYLWGPGKTHPPPLTTVTSALQSLIEKKTGCQVALFKNRKSSSPVELQTDVSLELLGQSDCMDLLKNLTYTTGDGSYGFVESTKIKIFCVYDKGTQWIDSKSGSVPLDADWHSGAVMVVNQGKNNYSTPVGIFSRSVSAVDVLPDKENLHIVLAFHGGVYEFLKKCGIKTETEAVSSKTTADAVHTTDTHMTTQSSCILAESEQYPAYVIRISEYDEDETIMYGHGSLIKADKVLSTCAPFRGIEGDMKEGRLQLTGYNFKERCKQERIPKAIVMHESCHKSTFPASNAPITLDFAIWTVDPFKMDGMPFLWGNGHPQPSPQSTVRGIIDSLLKFPKALPVGLFALGSSDRPDLQSGTKINFIDWFVCLDMLKGITEDTGDMTIGLNQSVDSVSGFYDYFCGYDIGTEWDSLRRNPNPVYADRYSGAAVTFEYPSGVKVPIGLLSRAVTVSSKNREIKNFRIIMGFHKGFFEFLSDNGIESSVVESEYRGFAHFTSAKMIAKAPGPHIRRARGGNNQPCVHSGVLWITHLTLFRIMWWEVTEK